METFLHILNMTGHGAAILIIWLLCLAGLVLSCVSLSGTWLVFGACLLALVVKTGTFPGVWTVVIFLLVAAAVELAEAVAGTWGVSRRGGSKLAGLAAMVGGILGLFVGALIPIPLVGSLLGMLVCSFVLVFLVEQRRLKKSGPAVDIAMGAVVARVLVTLLKVTVTLGMAAVLLGGMLLD